jgi:pimeloyl-ACP methyl ester carboxylesterase
VPRGAEAGELRLEPCQFKAAGRPYTAECGTLVVPENRGNSYSRLIALPVIRLRATSDAQAEPVFRLAGGPGLSNLKLKPRDWLLAEHDLVAVGYRGVDGAVVLDSPEVEQALRGVGRNLLGPESRANFGAAVRRCAARFEAEGVDLAGYTIPEVVADLEAARASLGYQRANLLSESYGTRVAQIYGQLHPERIHRSVMIGVNPPGRFVLRSSLAGTARSSGRSTRDLVDIGRARRPRRARLTGAPVFYWLGAGVHRGQRPCGRAFGAAAEVVAQRQGPDAFDGPTAEPAPLER